tara:strand:- start:13 stop:339 length:327 start_codon:yes stop_codon:yes gene_type:complete
MVNKPIIDDIAINGVVRLNMLKLEERLKNIKAIKLAISDHNVKNLNCFPNPDSIKTLDPEKKKISRTKKNAKERQVNLKSITSIFFLPTFSKITDHAITSNEIFHFDS